MPEEVGRIFDIQKFSLHDGPGIRTVVFLKGCPMACSWCSNPGSQKLQMVSIRDPENPAVFTGDSREYTIDEVITVCMQDLPFYEESGGGVTLSGGEALVQHRFATRLLHDLRQRGVHTAVETTGYAASGIFRKVLDEADLLIIDVKHHDSELHRKWTGVSNDRTLRNLSTSLRAGGEVLVRIPVIPRVNNSIADAISFCRLLKPLGVDRLQLLPFHQFGERKYELLGWKYRFKGVRALHEEDLTEYRQTFIDNGIGAYF